jgi:ketosteroid isomerase-like protein
MVRILSLLFLSAVALGPAPVSAQRPAPIDVEINQIVKLERDMWEAWRKHDLPALRALTSSDYVTVNEFGRSTWAEVEGSFGDASLESYTLGDIDPIRVSRDVILLSYPAEIHGTYKGADISRKVAECSVWRREQGRWRNVFLHEVTVK